jgi:glutamine amidotransferase
MREGEGARVAIVDYGMGNLFSVQQACRQVGLNAVMTAEPSGVLEADAVILPGVGAFGDAMAELARCDLIHPLRDLAASGKPLLCICLGMQLLMSESHEFGRHKGLNLIEGEVVRLTGRKVPQVGWNRIWPTAHASWEGTWLAGVPEGAFLYFVHSFYVRPVHAQCVLSTTRYGTVEFASSVRWRNVFACQFHPERSGPAGLAIYEQFAAQSAQFRAEVASS